MAYIPKKALSGYWRKMTGQRSEMEIVNSILDNIESRYPRFIDGKEQYPATEREMRILNLFRQGRLNPRSFSSKN